MHADKTPGTEVRVQVVASLEEGTLPVAPEKLLRDPADVRAENIDFIVLTSAPAADIDVALLRSPITPQALQHIADWKPDQIKTAISAEAISDLQIQDFARLPASFLNALSEAQVEAIAPQQFGSVPPETLSKITPDVLGLVAPRTFQSITAQQVQSLSIAHLEGLTVEQFNTLLAVPATAQLVQQKYAAPLLSGPLNDATAKMYADMVESDVQKLLPPSVIEKVRTDAFATLPADFLNNFSAEQLEVITAERFASLPPDTLKGIDPARLRTLATKAFEGLTKEQVEAFSTTQLNSLTSSQVNALSQEALGVLQDRYSAPLLQVPVPDAALKEFAGMFEYDVQKMILAETVAKIAPTEFRALPTSFVSKFTADQLAAITPDQFMQMTCETLQQLQPEQFAAISPTALAHTRQEQVDALHTAQVKGVTAEQLQVLIKLPGGKDTVQFAYAGGQLDAVEVKKQLATGATAASIRVVELEKMTPAAIAALGSEISNLSQPAIRAMSMEQAAAITPAQAAILNVAQVRALGAKISALSNDAIDAIAVATVASDTYALSLWRYGQEVQDLRLEKTPEIRNRLQAQAVKDDISKANLEGVFLPVVRGTDPSIGTFIHNSTKVHMQVEGPTGKLERVPAALYRAIKVDIPGVDPDEYQHHFNEFADDYAQWQAFNKLVAKEMSNSGVPGLRDTAQLTPAQQARIQPLLQARLDAALETRSKLEKLQGLLTDAGHAPDRLARINPNDTANAWRYIRFTPDVPAAEVRSEVRVALDQAILSIQPPQPELRRPAPLP